MSEARKPGATRSRTSPFPALMEIAPPSGGKISVASGRSIHLLKNLSRCSDVMILRPILLVSSSKTVTSIFWFSSFFHCAKCQTRKPTGNGFADCVPEKFADEKTKPSSNVNLNTRSEEHTSEL